MGRAGGGGGGRSSHSSSSSHSFSSRSHSGSSHSFGGSSGRASRSSSGSRSSGGGNTYYHSSHQTTVYRHGGYYSYTELSPVQGALLMGFILVFMAVIFMFCFWANDPISNTTNREKLSLGYGYPNANVTDELDWIKMPGLMNRDLVEFYNTTGVIPYIALVSRPDVTAAGTEEAYAHQWYDEHLPNQGYLLLMYFDTGNPNVDGNCYLVCGEQVGVLFDAEAQNIFWEYLDSYWYSDADEDTMFTQTFLKTGKRIMQRGSAATDLLKNIFIVIAIISIIFGIIKILKTIRQHEAERAMETMQILGQPIKTTQSSTEEDDLLNKYSDSDSDS